MNYISLIIFFSCLCISGIVGYTVTGNKIYDPNGKQVLLRGVDRPSFEWNINGEQSSANDYVLMRSWGANVVRIATNQDFWLGSQYTLYQGNIDQQVNWAINAGLGVILDLHWNQGGQQNMADRNSITFWSQVAAKYKSNAWVMFELYNEPHDVSWAQWLSGDSNYAGMQEMYAAVRAAGALNTVLVGGLNWAYDLSGVTTGGYALTGINIAYATHPYDYAGKQSTDWPTGFGNLASTYPVVMTEFGQYCNADTYVSDLLIYADAHGIHWTAWAWYVSGCSFPSIISDWSGTPSAGVGALVKSYLSGTAPSTPVVTATSAPASGNSAPASGSSAAGSAASASSALSVYADSLASGWQDWSWASSYSLSDTTYVHSGSKSIKFNVQLYQGVYFHYTSSFTIGSYASLQFYVNGGLATFSASSLSVKVYGSAGSVIGNSANFPVSVPNSQWSLITIPVSSFGLASTTAITGIVIQSNVDASAGNIWIDDISFVPAASSSTPASTATSAPTTAPTQAATKAPTSAPTSAPTQAATKAPTAAPTSAPTQAATKAPTTAPTSAPTQAATKAPTSAPTTAPSSGCGASSVQITQTAGSSWPANGGTVTQYDVRISHTCTGKSLVALTISASNWNSVNTWSSTVVLGASGKATLTFPSYMAATASNPYTFGYQNLGGQASFTITSATFL